MRIVTMTEATFDDRRDAGRLDAGVIYNLSNVGREGVGFSPDGVGFFWYDSIEEAMREHA